MQVLFHYIGLGKLGNPTNATQYHKNQMNIRLEAIVMMASFLKGRKKMSSEIIIGIVVIGFMVGMCAFMGVKIYQQKRK